MLYHERDYFFVAEFFLTQTKLAIDSFTRAQKLARLDAHLLDQFAQFPLAQRLDVVIDFLKAHATLTEQLVQLATLRSSRLFVNSDFVSHDG